MLWKNSLKNKKKKKRKKERKMQQMPTAKLQRYQNSNYLMYKYEDFIADGTFKMFQ